MNKSLLNIVAAWLVLSATAPAIAADTGIRLKDVARIDGAHDNALVGYGIVVGLSGSGDSPRNRATLQSVANTLANFGVRVSESDLSARNTAAVMVTATMSAYAQGGDQLDVQVASMGDARSLAGGTLVLTPLYGPDQQIYALSQGALAVGGYRFESFADSAQKNHPTVGRIPRGATIERAPRTGVGTGDASRVAVVLDEPDYTTAQRMVDAIQAQLGVQATAVHPGRVELAAPADLMPFIARLENVRLAPDHEARVVVNERTGTIVAGSDVRIDAVSIVHGDLRVTVDTRFDVSQPQVVGRQLPNVRTQVVPDTEIDVREGVPQTVELPGDTTVSHLVRALQRIDATTQDIISILQSIKTAGALHAELVIQ